MIYIIKHKKCVIPEKEGYVQLGVGDEYIGIGDNINTYNPLINEVTGLYDIWRNYSDEIVGLCHYRRFFEKDRKILTFEDAKEILKTHEVITTTDFSYVPRLHLTRVLDPEITTKYLKMLPDKVHWWFYAHQNFNVCNMFVAKREFVNEYCEWLFPIILPMANRFLKEDLTSDYRANRAVGFITECLFGYYCQHKDRYQLPIKHIGE